MTKTFPAPGILEEGNCVAREVEIICKLPQLTSPVWFPIWIALTSTYTIPFHCSWTASPDEKCFFTSPINASYDSWRKTPVLRYLSNVTSCLERSLGGCKGRNSNIFALRSLQHSLGHSSSSKIEIGSFWIAFVNMLNVQALIWNSWNVENLFRKVNFLLLGFARSSLEGSSKGGTKWL